MTSREILSVLENCAPSQKYKRNCELCPLKSFNDCHARMCQALISYVTESRSKIERLNVEADKIISAVAVMRTL